METEGSHRTAWRGAAHRCGPATRRGDASAHPPYDARSAASALSDAASASGRIPCMATRRSMSVINRCPSTKRQSRPMGYGTWSIPLRPEAPLIGGGSFMCGGVDLGDNVCMGRGCIIRVTICERTRRRLLRSERRVGMCAGNRICPFCTTGTGPRHTDAPRPCMDEIVRGLNSTMRRGYAPANLPPAAEHAAVGSKCYFRRHHCPWA